MKRILYYVAVVVMGAALAVSCTPEEENFDETLLYSGDGEWTFTADYGDGPAKIGHKFNADGSGYEINITMEQFEPQEFSWELVGSRLTFFHNVTMGGAVPEDCTVSTLNETTLIYTDEYGDRITCTKEPLPEN
jgi:hypothetical protein